MYIVHRTSYGKNFQIEYKEWISVYNLFILKYGRVVDGLV